MFPNQSGQLLKSLLTSGAGAGAWYATAGSTGDKLSDLSDADRFYLSHEYKAQVVSAMSTSQLIEICLINPTVTLTPSYR